MKKLVLSLLLITQFACRKNTPSANKPSDPDGLTHRCGTILNTPILDSFIYPTYYITTLVAFPEGNEVVHFHDQVTGDHDSSWFLPKYDKDSSYCTTAP